MIDDRGYTLEARSTVDQHSLLEAGHGRKHDHDVVSPVAGGCGSRRMNHHEVAINIHFIDRSHIASYRLDIPLATASICLSISSSYQT